MSDATSPSSGHGAPAERSGGPRGIQSIELGYRDFRYMEEDRDLDSIRKDPRFRQLLRDYHRGS